MPVTVIPTREWPDYELPLMPKFQVNKRHATVDLYICINCGPLFQMSIQLPTLRSLRSLLDKMKNLAPSLTICSASNGDLSFIVETDSAMVVSRYYNLMLENINGDASTTVKDGQLEEITCLVDSKQIAMCCASIQVTLER